MPESIRVRILNRDFSLRVDEEAEELTRRIARYVDKKMQAFLREHPHQPEVTASIITAMAIAEELFTERDERARLEAELDAELGQLADRLDGALPAFKESAGTAVS